MISAYICIGAALSVQGGGLMILLACLWWLLREYKRKKDAKLKKKNFKRNGGLLLEQLLSSNEDTVKKIKLFNSKEMEKATGDYHRRRIIGRGGQGIVYIGMLTDGKIVAVKKSRAVLDESKGREFINEVVILSKINHRNVVKILGCCLETEFPILVYEYIPNGTLLRRIHEQDEDNPFPWDMRLQIAKEVSVALCYLHSQATTPIYHRDIKSTNILLDERLRAKVADFGISMSVPNINKTHMTTMVRGTFGYLDPEYFQSNKFTEKSDVYSFGVVLAELLTSLKPILSRNSSTSQEETISLAAHFVVHMEQNLFFEIVDARIDEVGRREEIMAMANLARRCLNLSGTERPTMMEVAIELDGIMRMSREASPLNNS